MNSTLKETSCLPQVADLGGASGTHSLANWMPANIQIKPPRIIACPCDIRAFSLHHTIVRVCSIIPLIIYIFHIFNLHALAWENEFKLQWDKLSSFVETKLKIWQSLWHQLVTNLNASPQTIEDRVQNLNSIAHPCDERAFSMLYIPGRIWFSPACGDIHIYCF